MLTLILGFDALIKGIYNQIESDKISKLRQRRHGAFHRQKQLDEMEHALELIQTLSIFTFMVFTCWYFNARQIFNDKFMLISDTKNCIIPPFKDKTPNFKILEDFQILSNSEKQISCTLELESKTYFCDFQSVIFLKAPLLWFLNIFAFSYVLFIILVQFFLSFLSACKSK